MIEYDTTKTEIENAARALVSIARSLEHITTAREEAGYSRPVSIAERVACSLESLQSDEDNSSVRSSLERAADHIESLDRIADALTDALTLDGGGSAVIAIANELAASR
jgi:hypothetical protein